MIAIWHAKIGIRVFPLHWPVGHGCSCGKPRDRADHQEVVR